MGWEEIGITEDPRLANFRYVLHAALTSCVEQGQVNRQGAAMIYAFTCGAVRWAFLDEDRDAATEEEILRLMSPPQTMN